MFVDARIPVVFGCLADIEAADAVLTDGADAMPAGQPVARLGGSSPAPDHPGPIHPGPAAGCLCCLPRAAAGEALSRLFQARGRGEVAFFRRVLAIVEDAEMVRRAVLHDRLASAWFRLG